MNQQMIYSPNQYQGNVASEGLQQQMSYQGFTAPNFMNHILICNKTSQIRNGLFFCCVENIVKM